MILIVIVVVIVEVVVVDIRMNNVGESGFSRDMGTVGLRCGLLWLLSLSLFLFLLLPLLLLLLSLPLFSLLEPLRSHFLVAV